MEWLIEAIGAPWHGITEELIRVVSMQDGVEVVPVLVRIASQPPACLFDELGVTASNNALYGLKRIGTNEARHAIEDACADSREYVAATARMLLARMEQPSMNTSPSGKGARSSRTCGRATGVYPCDAHLPQKSRIRPHRDVRGVCREFG